MNVHRSAKAPKKTDSVTSISTCTNITECKKLQGKGLPEKIRLTPSAIKISVKDERKGKNATPEGCCDSKDVVVENSIFRKCEINITAKKDIMMTDNIKNVLKCGYCPQVFSAESTLINHLLSHDNRPYKPLRQMKLSSSGIQSKVEDVSQNQEFKKCKSCLSPTIKNKKYNKLSFRSDLSSSETSNLRGVDCNGQNVVAEYLDLCAIPERQNNTSSKECKEKMLSPIRDNSQSDKKGIQTPRQVMESVGKRKAKKRYNDDYITYELNIKKRNHKCSLIDTTKTGSKVIIKQELIRGNSTSKKLAKNPKQNSRLRAVTNVYEVNAKSENSSIRNENNQGTNIAFPGAKVVRRDFKTAGIVYKCPDDFFFHSRSSHDSKYSVSEKENNTSKNNSTWSGGSYKVLIDRQVKYKSIISSLFLKCVTCKGCFLWKLPFLDHIKIHPSKMPFECLTCKSRFLSFFSYVTHIRNFHSSDKTHCCPKCDKRYSSWYLLKLHLIRHESFSSSSRYLCSLCDKAFTYKYILSKHLVNKHHGANKDTLVPLSCKPCGKLFRDRRNLWIHQKRHSNAVKPYKCHLCHRTFAIHKWLIDHIHRHIQERNYSCNLCGKSYFTKSDAALHERRHTKEASFPCKECDKKFIYRSELNAHLKRHQGIRLPKNIVCDICSKAFSTRRDLERHLTVHTGEKPYKCHICSKCFSQEVNMQAHAKIHSGERPYQCDLCDKRFIAKSKLARHRQCHVTSKGLLPRPYKCVLCPKKYTAENSLIRHLRTHRDSVEIVANIKTALNKAAEESNTTQRNSCAGAVLACMIDQAILDARRMAHKRKNQGGACDPTLAEIIDQAIHDSKTTSSTQTPISIEASVNTQVSHSNTSKNVEIVVDTEKEANIPDVSVDISSHYCSDLIKLISDALSEHIGANPEVHNSQPTQYQNSSMCDPYTQTMLVKPKNSLPKPEDQEIITSNPQKSLLKPITVPHDNVPHQQAMISLDLSNSQHIYIENLNLTPDVPSSQREILVMPVSDLDTAGSEHQVFLLSEQTHTPQSSPSVSYITCQQNILAVNGQSTLVMIPSSLSLHSSSTSLPLHSSTSNIQQAVLPKDVTSLAKNEMFVLIPTGTRTNNHSVGVKSTNPG